MSGVELMQELSAKVSLLDSALQQLGNRGRAYAKAEQDKGTPVTIISDICRGNAEIAGLKFNRDVAETSYKAALEACNVYKLQIKVLENQIDREYRG